jgi:hypothetical protein
MRSGRQDATPRGRRHSGLWHHSCTPTPPLPITTLSVRREPHCGGCLCGAVRYSRHTGTAFVSGLAVPSDAVSIVGTMDRRAGFGAGAPVHGFTQAL